MISEKLDSSHVSIGINGLSLSDSILEIQSNDWTMKTKYRIGGKSGALHDVDFYFESGSGIKVLIIREEPSENSMYEIIGRIQMLRMEVGTDYIFVLCSCGDYNNSFLKALSTTQARMINKLKFGDQVFTGGSGGSNQKRSIKSENSASRLKIKRDRIRIMLDIMELLNDQSSRITNIIYKCNLNYRTANEMLDEMIRKNYVESRKDNEKGNSYSLTKIGREAMSNVRKVYE